MVAKTDLKARLLDLTTGVLELTRDGARSIGDVCDVFQIIKEDPEFAVRLLGRKKDELDLSVENAFRFLREFCGIEVNLPGPDPKGRWTIPCAKELTYERLAALIEERKVPRRDMMLAQLRKVDATFDCRKAEDGDYLLFTPAGVEATGACPDFVGVSYRQLWGDKSVLTCREAVILWLFVWFSSKGKTLLDAKGWTRTSSRYIRGFGVCVDGCEGGLNVYWYDPDDFSVGGSARSAVSL